MGTSRDENYCTITVSRIGKVSQIIDRSGWWLTYLSEMSCGARCATSRRLPLNRRKRLSALRHASPSSDACVPPLHMVTSGLAESMPAAARIAPSSDPLLSSPAWVSSEGSGMLSECGMRAPGAPLGSNESGSVPLNWPAGRASSRFTVSFTLAGLPKRSSKEMKRPALGAAASQLPTWIVAGSVVTAPPSAFHRSSPPSSTCTRSIPLALSSHQARAAHSMPEQAPRE
ncbi:hypothetical protein PMAYCL1PPCAC_14686 [Pristionchus mayeri]|uniref:Uncharacterized protein n=1 Tax=Pristionchus mayeri TaxID=1317129 RepID=A0AAN4ZPH3_9BILA|nr:hypothetical protein PMAYCL1PPCAC_14686 [Pristionchus mayeri]